jgi:Protein of unknown function (DUF3551)
MSRRDIFRAFAGRRRELRCYFSVLMAPISATSHVSTSEMQQHGEIKMRQFLKVTVPATALLALAYVAMATPAAAAKYEYCRQDVTSGMRSCGFETLEQCQTMSSGRGGTCYRDPLLTDTSSAYAYQPKPPLSRSLTLHAKKPLKKQ